MRKKKTEIQDPTNPPSNHYFTQKHEDAIVSYIESVDRFKRDKIFEKDIMPVFKEMIDKIVYTFKFTSLPNVELLKEECLVYLVTILCNFDKSKGHRAFGYFSVIIKNWFIAAVKKQTRKLKHEISFDDVSEDELVHDSKSGAERIIDSETWDFVHREIQEWNHLSSLKENDKKMLDAIDHLFNNRYSLDLENKRAIYLYLREITGFNTKQVNAMLTSIKKRYKESSKEWNDTDDDIREFERSSFRKLPKDNNQD